jgi:hypothetical protein
MKHKIVGAEIATLVIFQVTNILFVYKYSTRVFQNSSIPMLLYLVSINLFLVLLYQDFNFTMPGRVHNMVFFLTAVAIAVGLVFLMKQFDPTRIRVGRFPALHDWIARLLNGEYPYVSPTRPSGFPFLFLIAVPFYLLADLGFIQIFALLLYALLLHRKHGGCGTTPLRTLLLVASAPVFLYEVVTRSDLFSNMVFVLFYLSFCETGLSSARSKLLALAGFVGGLLLATRGIVLLIYVLYFGYIFKNHLSRGFVFLVGVLAGFCAAVLPFAMWNWQYFMDYGPLTIQTSYLPIWLSLLAVMCCAYLATRIGSMTSTYRVAGFVLFAVVFLALAISVVGNGWTAAIHGDRFDISYFCFALPFLLLTVNYGRPRKCSS